MAVEIISREVEKSRGKHPGGILASAVQSASAFIRTRAQEDAALQGMGTTLTALMRCGANGLALVHIGDSRAYLLRDGHFSQITRDHSFVQSLVDAGRISEEEAEHHPQRSLVTRVLRRLSNVRSAELLAADDPRLIQSVLVEAPAAPPTSIRLIPLDERTALAVGAPIAMHDWLASTCAPRRLGAVRLDILT